MKVEFNATHNVKLLAVLLLATACDPGQHTASAPTEDALDASAPNPSETFLPTVFAFSQVSPDGADPQVLQLQPDIVIRAWQRWDIYGARRSDYSTEFLQQCHELGIRFIGGTTTSALFPRESPEHFEEWATRSAQGELVEHDNILPNMYRSSLAHPDYRKYIVDLMKIQIDLGVDGLSFDELNGGYHGYDWVSKDEGFDDHHLADFNDFLLSAYPGADYQEQFGMEADNLLTATLPASDLVGNFNYRTYLANHGWANTPLSPANPLAEVWGQTKPNRARPDAGTFIDTVVPEKYWKAIAEEVRSYARDQYDRELLLTSNGLWPYVDFHSVGLYDFNVDGENDSSVDYVPTQGGELDGTRSLQAAFLALAAQAERLAPGAPVVLFLDWPNSAMDRYNALPLEQRKDYWRLYAAEAYANGLFFAFHLLTTTGEPSATEAGVMDTFQALSRFYRTNATLYHGVTKASDSAVADVENVMVSVMDQADPWRRLIHLVNHNYQGEILPQGPITVRIALPAAPTQVYVVSPDTDARTPLEPVHTNGELTLTIPSLVAYDVIVVEY